MAVFIQVNATRGEISPYLDARIDLDHYKAGLGLCRNFVPMRFGGLVRFPGSVFYGATKFPGRYSRWIPFEFKRNQTYAIELGHQYMRFWNFAGRVESSPGVPVEVTTPYIEADLPYVQTRQSGDVVYIACDGYAPRELARVSEINWTFGLHAALDGPYLPQNPSGVTITPSATSGSMNITLSSVSVVNGGGGWNSGDIGRAVRFMGSDAAWRWFRITAVTSTTVAVATLFGSALPNTNARSTWRLGAWSGYSGYPTSVGIYEDRLGWGGTPLQPINVWYSVNGDYDNHAISSPLVDDDAVSLRMTGGTLNAIQWLAEGRDILIGTEGTLRAIGRNDLGGAFSATNARQRKENVLPVAFKPPLTIETMTLLLDIYRTKMFEVDYSEEQGGYVARELSALNEHLFALGIRDYAYQSSPHKIIWCVTDEGTLLAVTYDRDQQVFGVSECDLGGDSYVEAVLTLPGIDKDGDQLWLTVRRTIDGDVVRYVELLSSFFRAGYTEQDYPIYAHSAGVYEGTATNSISGLHHLEGEVVGVWAGGVDAGNYTVTGGIITFPVELASDLVVFGIRYSSEARTLRLAVDTREGNTFGKRITVSDGLVDVYQTAGLSVGSLYATDPLRAEEAIEENPYDPAVLRTGIYPVVMDDSWDNNGVMTVYTNSMHPATVRAFIAVADAEDN